MSDTCEVFASVTADFLEVMGSSEAPAIYICTRAAVVPKSVPVVCGTAMATHAIGKWAQTPAGKALIEEVSRRGCEVVYSVSSTCSKIIVTKGARLDKDTRRIVSQARNTYRSFNSADGVRYLMRRLTGR